MTKQPTGDAVERFLANLATLRERGWSMEALAEETGVGLATVSRWCRGTSQPSRALLNLAAPVLARLVRRKSR